MLKAFLITCKQFAVTLLSIILAGSIVLVIAFSTYYLAGINPGVGMLFGLLTLVFVVLFTFNLLGRD
jgi:hypothetical protein